MTSRAPGLRRKLPSPLQLAILAMLSSAAHPAWSADPAPPADDAKDSSLPVVTVTATKRSTGLQETPLAVSAIGSAELEKNNVQTIADVVHLVPSFQATTEGDHGVITMTLRGIGNDSAKTEYADPEVALFVDGIYAPRAEGAAALLFDMEAIEVLRGPQGTLWGRNSTVGAVNMRTARPVLGGETFGTLEAGLGSYQRNGERGAINLPVTDNLAFRIAFAHEQHDGYVNYQTAPHLSLASQQSAYTAAGITSKPFIPLDPNLFVQGGPKYNAQDQSAVRLSMLWKPSDALTWNLSYENFADRGTPDMNLMQTPRPGQDFWSALISVAPYLHRDVNTLRSRIDYQLSPDLNLAYIAGWSRFSGSSDFDQSGGAKVPTSFATGASVQEDRTNWSHYENYSHELELSSTGKRDLDWILGLYYAAEDNSIRFDIPIFNGTEEGTVGWQGSFIQPKETVESKAVFGQATWNLQEALHLTAGLRYTQDDRSNVGGTNNGWSNDPSYPQVPLDPGANPLAVGFQTYQHNDGHYSGSKLTWLARAGYDLSPTQLLYASVSTGYKSGGLQDGGAKYGQETLYNYELGSKSTLLGGRMVWNNALYYEDFKDFQFSAPVTNPDGSHSLATSNAEGAKVYGLESELAVKLGANDKLQLSLALTHSRLGHLIAGSNDYSLPACSVPGISNCLDVTGHTMPHAPSLAAQVAYEHSFRLDSGGVLTPRANVHYETSSWLSVFNLGDGDRQEAYARMDLGLRYASPKTWYLDALVQNVGDTKVKTNAQNAFGVWQSQYMAPVTYSVNLGTYF